MKSCCILSSLQIRGEKMLNYLRPKKCMYLKWIPLIAQFFDKKLFSVLCGIVISTGLLSMTSCASSSKKKQASRVSTTQKQVAKKSDNLNKSRESSNIAKASMSKTQATNSRVKKLNLSSNKNLKDKDVRQSAVRSTKNASFSKVPQFAPSALGKVASQDLIITNEKLFTGSKAQNEKIEEVKLLSELKGNKISAKNDIELYELMTKAYQEKQTDLIKLYTKDFEARFSKSDLLDNAWYLTGLALSENSEYYSALSYFQKIETYSPYGDRASQAKLAKALMYKKMGLLDVSVLNLKELVKRYPGSPESYRAANELKLATQKR